MTETIIDEKTATGKHVKVVKSVLSDGRTNIEVEVWDEEGKYHYKHMTPSELATLAIKSNDFLDLHLA